MGRPFGKFFNYTEVATPKFVWGKPATLFEKVDGSLGIIYPLDGGYSVATRGSFASDQAVWASNFLSSEFSGFSQPDGVTTLVEIVYPENRIVVDYKGKRQLVLLGAVRHDGTEIPLWEIDWWDGPRAEVHGEHDIDSAYTFATSDRFEDEEGIVACWHIPGEPTYRLKIKHPEYLRLHRLLTGVSNRTVWIYNAVSDARDRGIEDKKLISRKLGWNPEQIQELLDTPADPLESLLDNVPDEFYDWVKKTQQELQDGYMRLLEAAQDDFWAVMKIRLTDMDLDEAIAFVRSKGRKEFAEEVQKTSDVPHLVYALLDGKDLCLEIWKMLKPERQLPFQSEDNSAS